MCSQTRTAHRKAFVEIGFCATKMGSGSANFCTHLHSFCKIRDPSCKSKLVSTSHCWDEASKQEAAEPFKSMGCSFSIFHARRVNEAWHIHAVRKGRNPNSCLRTTHAHDVLHVCICKCWPGLTDSETFRHSVRRSMIVRSTCCSPRVA